MVGVGGGGGGGWGWAGCYLVLVCLIEEAFFNVFYIMYVTYVQEKHVNLIHIESRKSKRRDSDFEIFVDCDSDHAQLKELTQLLRTHTDIVEITPSDNSSLPDDGRPCFPFDLPDA